jgi:hypothetical protein
MLSDELHSFVLSKKPFVIKIVLANSNTLHHQTFSSFVPTQYNTKPNEVMSESKCVLTLEQGQPPSKWPLPAAKLLKPDDSTLDPFLTACEEADISTVSLLAKHRDEKDGSLNWGLYNALSANRHDIADLLLSQGVPIDKRAVLETKSPECFQVLLDHEWDINSSVECGGTIFPCVQLDLCAAFLE